MKNLRLRSALLVGLTASLSAQTFNISTVAGEVARANGDGTQTSRTTLFNPSGIAIDPSGNIYVADGDAHRVRKFDPVSGTSTVIAGQGRNANSGDAPVQGTASPLNDPTGLVVDPTGAFLYIAERDASKIKKLDLGSGVLTTVVGYGGRAGYAGDGQPALYGRVRNPFALAVDAAGNIYIADRGNNKIRKVTIATGKLSTVAGVGPYNQEPVYLNQYFGDGGLATSAGLARPEGVAVDAGGNVFISDTNNNRIRRVDAATGIITTVIGTCISGAPIAAVGNAPAQNSTVQIPAGSPWPTCGTGTQATAANPVVITTANSARPLTTFIDGPGANSTVNLPRGLAFDSTGNLYIADTSSHRIRVLRTDGNVYTFAGSGTAAGFSGDGGVAIRATLSLPRGVAVAPNGDVYFTDQTQGALSTASVNGRVRLIDASNGTIRSLNAPVYGGDSSAATNALLNDVRGLGVDALGNLLVVDTFNQRVRSIDANGVIDTYAGSGAPGLTGAFAGDTGSARSARMSNPNCVAVDSANSVYIADRSNNRVRKVDAYGNITTFAGGGTLEATDGIPATSAILNGPRCVALDPAGNVYIADAGNHVIRKVNVAGVISTVAGTWVPNPLPAGGRTFIGIYGPIIVATGPAGLVVQTAFSGAGGDGGPATAAYLQAPQSIAVDPQGLNLYVADTSNHSVRRIDLTTGIITLVAGNPTGAGLDGAPAGLTVPPGSVGPAELTSLNTPCGVAADANGNVYIADTANYRVVRVDKAGNAYVIGGGAAAAWGDNKAGNAVSLTMPRGITVDKVGNVYFAEPIGTIRKLTPQ